MAKRSSFGVRVRKKLSDITNSQIHGEVSVHDEKIPVINSPTDGYVDRLIKENMTLSRLLEQRKLNSKILELSGVEIRNLRLSIHKLQIQNLSLAQTNTQFLKEMNIARDMVKALQHEIMCKDAILKTNYSRSAVRERKVAADENLRAHEGIDGNAGKHEDRTSRRNRSKGVRSQSIGPPATRQNESQKEKDEMKSQFLRRKSTRFRSEEAEPKENLFEIEDINLAISSDRTAGRSSTGRPPVRRAADKVHSYREIPVNVKMRREE